MYLRVFPFCNPRRYCVNLQPRSGYPIQHTQSAAECQPEQCHRCHVFHEAKEKDFVAPFQEWGLGGTLGLAPPLRLVEGKTANSLGSLLSSTRTLSFKQISQKYTFKKQKRFRAKFPFSLNLSLSKVKHLNTWTFCYAKIFNVFGLTYNYGERKVNGLTIS